MNTLFTATIYTASNSLVRLVHDTSPLSLEYFYHHLILINKSAPQTFKQRLIFSNINNSAGIGLVTLLVTISSISSDRRHERYTWNIACFAVKLHYIWGLDTSTPTTSAPTTSAPNAPNKDTSALKKTLRSLHFDPYNFGLYNFGTSKILAISHI